MYKLITNNQHVLKKSRGFSPKAHEYPPTLKSNSLSLSLGAVVVRPNKCHNIMHKKGVGLEGALQTNQK